MSFIRIGFYLSCPSRLLTVMFYGGLVGKFHIIPTYNLPWVLDVAFKEVNRRIMDKIVVEIYHVD
jgi:hypothetical protein